MEIVQVRQHFSIPKLINWEGENLSNVTQNLYIINILLFTNLRGMLLHPQILWDWMYDLIIAFLF